MSTILHRVHFIHKLLAQIIPTPVAVRWGRITNSVWLVEWRTKETQNSLHCMAKVARNSNKQRQSKIRRMQEKPHAVYCAIGERNNTRNTRLGDRAFPVAGPRLWNSLPSNLRQSDLTLLQFRQALKTYLFGWPRLQHLVTFVFSVLYKCSYLLTYLLT